MENLVRAVESDPNAGGLGTFAHIQLLTISYRIHH